MTTSPAVSTHWLIPRWVDLIRRHAALAVICTVAVTGVAAWYVASNLSINTDTSDMLSADLPFRQDAERIDRAFPQFEDSIVVVINGSTADQADDAALALAAKLGHDKSLFRSVFDPAGSRFFRRNGLLFLDRDELSRLIDRLATAQAFLGTLGRDPTLRGLFKVLGLVLEGDGGDAPPGEIATVLEAIADVAEKQRAGTPGLLSWRALMEGKALSPEDRRRVIIVQPVMDFGSLQPAARPIAEIRRLAADLNLTPKRGVRVRLTGSAPLSEEELDSTVRGMGLAAVVSLVLVVGLLFWGLRSVRMALATIITLLSGLVLTAAFATAAVGALNLISVAFAVLFIGLSVDFGIHFALRYGEGRRLGAPHDEALAEAAEGTGGALTQCAVAAAIGFMSFLPTDYVGLAELGLISAGGMFIALGANLTILPAILTILPPRLDTIADVGDSGPPPLVQLVARWPRVVIAGALLLAASASIVLPQTRFDFDPLNLKDPSSESVSTLLDMMTDTNSAPYSVDVLAGDLDRAAALAGRLDKLEGVRDAITLKSFVPTGQDDKLEIIEQAALFLLPALGAPQVAQDAAQDRLAASREIRRVLSRFAADDRNRAKPAVAGARHLDGLLAAMLDSGDARLSLIELERRLLHNLPGRLGALRLSLEAGPVTLADLPQALRSRHVAADGQARVEIFPKGDLRDSEALEHFVTAVRTIAPGASGGPVTILEAGRAVVRSFLFAAAVSVLAISLLIAVLLRRARDIVMVFTPLSLAAMLTMAASVVLDVPFNFANVIVLPLLFGLGVASAIHLVMRLRRNAGSSLSMVGSTPRAVVFSAATTMGSFGSIALSSHPGTASMGLLLTIAITLTLICTLTVLPALFLLSYEASSAP